MASALDTAQVEILEALETAWADQTDIAWPNVGFTPPDGSWLRLDVLWGDGFTFTMGTPAVSSGPANQLIGVIQGTVFTRRGEADGELYGLLDSFRDIFNRVDLGTVRCEAASGPIPIPDDEWNAAAVRVPFQVYETVTA